jgi:hypothetical protein
MSYCCSSVYSAGHDWYTASHSHVCSTTNFYALLVPVPLLQLVQLLVAYKFIFTYRSTHNVLLLQFRDSIATAY